MALNSSSSKPPEPEEGYVWTFPGCPIRVDLRLDVVERLSNEVLQDTGCETGGLLLGKIDPQATGTVAIMEYEPLRPAHGDNNRFVLSAAKIANLEARLSSGTTASELRVVGYYRSHLGEAICLTDNDLHLINRCFTDRSNVFLVIKPMEGGTPAAGFFFWGQDAVFGAYSFLEFPLNARALASKQYARKILRDLNDSSTARSSAPAAVVPKPESGSPLSTVASEASVPVRRTSRLVVNATSTKLPEESYVWTFPGCPIRVELQLQVVERLSNEALQDTGCETGGLLLGKIDPRVTGTVAIMQYEPLWPAHGDNNRFVLSAAEIAKLETRLASGTTASELSVVGYYRSRLAEALCLTDNDLHLINRCFTDRSNVFLVIKPIEGGTPTAGFFFWGQDAVFGAYSFLEFPFHAPTLAAEQHARGSPHELNDNSTIESGAPQEVTTKAPKSDGTPSAAASQRPIPVRRPRLRERRLAILFAALLSVMALLVLLRVSTKSRNSSLGLQIEADGSDFRVSWNRASAFISRARNGRLFIRDGNQQERYIVLDGPMLRTGTIVYSPASTSEIVKFRFEVTGRDGSTAIESVIAVVRGIGRTAAVTGPQPLRFASRPNAARRPTRPKPGPA